MSTPFPSSLGPAAAAAHNKKLSKNTMSTEESTSKPMEIDSSEEIKTIAECKDSASIDYAGHSRNIAVLTTSFEACKNKAKSQVEKANEFIKTLGESDTEKARSAAKIGAEACLGEVKSQYLVAGPKIFDTWIAMWSPHCGMIMIDAEEKRDADDTTAPSVVLTTKSKAFLKAVKEFTLDKAPVTSLAAAITAADALAVSKIEAMRVKKVKEDAAATAAAIAKKEAESKPATEEKKKPSAATVIAATAASSSEAPLVSHLSFLDCETDSSSKKTPNVNAAPPAVKTASTTVSITTGSDTSTNNNNNNNNLDAMSKFLNEHFTKLHMQLKKDSEACRELIAKESANQKAQFVEFKATIDTAMKSFTSSNKRKDGSNEKESSDKPASEAKKAKNK